MAAISTLQTLQLRDAAHQLAKRNWAGQEAGVIVVFCIVFVVAVGLTFLCVTRYLARRKAARPS
jgi:heme/copper-type cytochrome/quinol oxidase subunit 2